MSTPVRRRCAASHFAPQASAKKNGPEVGPARRTLRRTTTAAFSIADHGRLRKSFLGPLGRRPRRPRGPSPLPSGSFYCGSWPIWPDAPRREPDNFARNPAKLLGFSVGGEFWLDTYWHGGGCRLVWPSKGWRWTPTLRRTP